ncbi:Utp21 specific WD40 associated putative domain-containing protein [Zychaea mexicana]|uniref:Utp21 specific WD40 associated putative domain-containing protein n=1 Tax=Zychaea mexicana TaxID=64656 RepID=UPI0022FE6222|nr:Utp21 specific WD40 associated putative domain-containing protein [Zychaea mexicana]KAI9497520.1 Utp21 specific WD40 associated putative domain-containing protein [Zychaea mexicana]
MVAPNEKRRRVESNSRSPARSRVFQPFRALGYITNDVPFVIETRGQDFFMTTSVGHNFQTYNLAKMNLLFVSPRTLEPITAMTSAAGLTFVAHGTTIGTYKRGKEVARIEGEGSYSIMQILVLGQYIASLCDDNVLRMWNLKTGELYTEIEFGEKFTATTMIHPSTYLNKLLIGSTQGTMQIWNVRIGKMVYQMDSFGSALTCLEQSPVVDVVAIGLLDGSVILHNIKVNEKIDTVHQDDRVTSISFRTDEQQVMATGNMHGDIALWDLTNRRLVHNMKAAHNGLIASLAFLSNQPVLVSAGVDNAVKQWIFEQDNAVPLPLKSRSGHFAPPTKIQYYGNDGTRILSAGRDRALRMFSTVRDAQNYEFSQGHVAKKAKSRGVSEESLKLPIITDFAAGSAKDKEWANVITSHMNDNGGRTWRTKNKAIADHTLLSSDKSANKVACISACGNFGFIGSASGQIDMFNLQSGIHRKAYAGADGHKKAITGLATDVANRYLISASVDRNIKIWDFKTGVVLHTIDMESPIVKIEFHRENDLLAVACDDLGIRILDLETRNTIREFWGHRNRITDFTFSPDGRWIVSASLDTTVRTWDLPSSTMVDIFKVEDVVSSLTFSPTGDFLATAHVDNVGIFLWANRTQFANISLRSIVDDEVAELLELPSLAGLDEQDDDDEELEPPTQLGEDLNTAEQLTEEMITLSLEPRAKWQNLLNLETIKKRNKPKEAPKKPEQAPFFLPTVAGAKAKFDLSEETNKKSAEERSRRIHMSQLDIETEFTRHLRSCHENNDYSAFVDYAKTLSPSAMDVEIRTMPVDPELSCMNYFIESILYMLQSRKNFEMAQAWLSAFLSIHGDILVANPDNAIHSKLEETLNVQSDEFGRLSSQIHYGLCLIDFARR